MCLVALEDPGLPVFPTHRLVGGLDAAQREALARRSRATSSDSWPALEELAPPPGEAPLEIGYIDAHSASCGCALRDQAIADAALADLPSPTARLDTGVLEALLLKGALGLSDDDIVAHARPRLRARRRAGDRSWSIDGDFDAAFLMRPTPVELVREIAAAGVNMPPKSTYFFPKLPTGLLFNPLCVAPAQRAVRMDNEESAIERREMSMRGHRLQDEGRQREARRAQLHAHGLRCATISWPSTSRSSGRRRRGPEPAGAARGEPRIVHGDHDGDVRAAQGLGDRPVEVDAEFTPAERGCPTHFSLVLRLPADLHRGAGREPARDRREVPDPPHARRRGHVQRARRAGQPGAERGGGGPARGAARPGELGAPFRPPERARLAAIAPGRGAVPGLLRERERPWCGPRRHIDLRLHGGQISFPGGRPSPTTPT